ncbi:Aste57867_6825 [Aphanomyces stellatus]|nr:hypothetical protein As57867_006804 [Aphanomyces stellatus]VFT83789.1 Aste57867_6825 [Aphanomyces stellatus]
MRGLFCSGIQIGVALGSLCVTTSHYALGTGNVAWRFMVGFPVVLGALQVFLMPCMTQSPVWLVAKGQVDEARATMRQLYQPTNYDAILNAMVESHDEEQRELAQVNLWASFFSRKYAVQLAIAVVICSAQQLAGINSIMYYSASIFSSTGLTDPRVANTIINIVRTATLFVAARYMDKFKRKTLLVTGMLVMAVSSGALVVALVHTISGLAVASISLFIAAWAFSIGPMCWMVALEIYPDFLHANAGAVGTMCTWIWDFLVAVFYPVLSSSDNLGNYAFCIFVGLNVVIAAFVVVVVPETSHKTYVEIARSFGIVEVEHAMPADHDPWASSRASEKVDKSPTTTTTTTAAPAPAQ